MVAAAVITAAFGDGSDGDPWPGVIVTWIPEPGGGSTLAPDRTPIPEDDGTPVLLPTEMPFDPSATLAGDVSGFAYPIAGACLPEDESLMPNAPREYRQALHEGVDFYDSDNCTSIGLATEVLAARAGTVIRVDWAYQDLTAETLAQLMERVEQEGGEDPALIDAFRGRQIWIEHGGGVVTRYAHLSGIAEGIMVGVEVEQGEVIAHAGESGTPESVTAPGTQAHLHFEIRIGDGFLGQGLTSTDARYLYERAFLP